MIYPEDFEARLGFDRVRALIESRLSTRLAREKLAEIEEIRPLSDPDYEIKHAWHLFIVRVVSDRMDRDTFMAELKARNIGTGLHFRCTHLQKYYRDVMGCKPGSLPNTEWNSDRILSLPLFPSMTEGDQDDVINAIKEILAS